MTMLTDALKERLAIRFARLWTLRNRLCGIADAGPEKIISVQFTEHREI